MNKGKLTSTQLEVAMWIAEGNKKGKIADEFIVDWDHDDKYIPTTGKIKDYDGWQPEMTFGILQVLESERLLQTIHKEEIEEHTAGTRVTKLYRVPKHEKSRHFSILGSIHDALKSNGEDIGKVQGGFSEGPFISQIYIEKLSEISHDEFDLKRLIQYCKEVNDNYQQKNYSSVAFLSRAIVDHIPPIFGQPNFESVAEQAKRGDFRKYAQHLDSTLKAISNHHIHKQIGKDEILPSKEEVNFSTDLNFIIGRIIEKLKE